MARDFNLTAVVKDADAKDEDDDETEGSNEPAASEDVLGFQKDCGPRKGVRLFSYRKAMHVRALNHPHLTFERRGKDWVCTSEGFPQLEIGAVVDPGALPTFESECRAHERAKAKRKAELKQQGVGAAEVARRTKAEFPAALDPAQPVKYIVSFPLGRYMCSLSLFRQVMY